MKNAWNKDCNAVQIWIMARVFRKKGGNQENVNLKFNVSGWVNLDKSTYFKNIQKLRSSKKQR